MLALPQLRRQLRRLGLGRAHLLLPPLLRPLHLRLQPPRPPLRRRQRLIQRPPRALRPGQLRLERAPVAVPALPLQQLRAQHLAPVPQVPQRLPQRPQHRLRLLLPTAPRPVALATQQLAHRGPAALGRGGRRRRRRRLQRRLEALAARAPLHGRRGPVRRGGQPQARYAAARRMGGLRRLLLGLGLGLGLLLLPLRRRPREVAAALGRHDDLVTQARVRLLLRLLLLRCRRRRPARSAARAPRRAKGGGGGGGRQRGGRRRVAHGREDAVLHEEGGQLGARHARVCGAGPGLPEQLRLGLQRQGGQLRVRRVGVQKGGVRLISGQHSESGGRERRRRRSRGAVPSNPPTPDRRTSASSAALLSSMAWLVRAAGLVCLPACVCIRREREGGGGGAHKQQTNERERSPTTVWASDVGC